MDMDQVLLGALTAVRFDDSAWAEPWFRAVCAGYDEAAADGEPSWADLFTAVREKALGEGFSDTHVDQFAEYLAGVVDPVATVGELRRYDTDLPAYYADAMAQEQEQEAAAEPAEEPVEVGAYPELSEGHSGEWVEYLETMLRSKGF